MLKCNGEKAANLIKGRDLIQFKMRCAQASLYLCTLLYLCSFDWQKLWVRWAKAILVNSLHFMRRVIPRLFQLSFARACRDESWKPASQLLALFAAENFTLDLLFYSIDLTFVFSCVPFWNSSWPCCFNSRQTNSRFVFFWMKKTSVGVTFLMFPEAKVN